MKNTPRPDPGHDTLSCGSKVVGLLVGLLLLSTYLHAGLTKLGVPDTTKPVVQGLADRPRSGAQRLSATCPPNIDFEFGNFQRWESNTGRVRVGPGPSNLITYDQATWTQNTNFSQRQELMDRNASPAVDYWGKFPVNPPFGGNRYAMRLGSDRNDPTSRDSLPNALADAIRYVVDVPAQSGDFSLHIAYAVVFENPNHPNNLHTFEEQPRFIMRMYEPGGDTLSCVNYTFVASDPLPGFDTSIHAKLDSATTRYPGGINFAPVKFKPWSTLYVNLTAYAGKRLYLEFITTDCTKRGHFGYAYVDVLECQTPVSAETACGGKPVTMLKGPPGFASYTWWNRDFTRQLGAGQNLTLDPALSRDEVPQVIFTPYSGFGCRDTLSTPIRVTGTQSQGMRYPTVKTIANTPTPLQARPGAADYLWNPFTGLDNPRIQKPVFRFDRDTDYLIRINSREGCSMTDTLNVIVYKSSDIYVPSAFSPNGDGHNDYLDVFTPGMREIRFWVFNRWGQLMFETRDPKQRWDGYFKGNRQPLETYVWIAEGITLTGERIRRRGQTVLVR